MSASTTRRSFVKATGLAACLAGTATVTGTCLAFADEATESLMPALAERQTLHGLEDSMFDPNQEISDEQIELIIQAGLSAPSAVGAQSLEFVVLRDREAMQQLHATSPNANQLESCPVAIVLVEHDTEDAHSRFFAYDSGLAAMAMLAQATSMGFATCVMEARLQDKDTKEDNDFSFIGVDETYHPQLIIALGTPAVDAVTGASVNNDATGRIHYETIEQ
jgi:nitroreductase